MSRSGVMDVAEKVLRCARLRVVVGVGETGPGFSSISPARSKRKERNIRRFVLKL